MSDEELSALLTPGQRDYLQGESDIEPSSANERAVRNRIRNRLRQSISDLSIINEHLEPRDLEQAFDLVDLMEFSAPIALLLDIHSRVKLDQVDESKGAVPNDEAIDGFEAIYAGALRDLYIKRGHAVEEISVDIGVKLGDDFDEIDETELSQLPNRQIIQLFEAGEIDRYEFITALESEEDEMSFEPDGDELR